MRPRWIVPASAAALLVAAVTCSEQIAGNPCEGVDCSSRGFCIAVGTVAYCGCMNGFHPVGLTCVANDPGDPCAGVECSGHGTCRPEVDGITCDCETGYGHLVDTEERCAEIGCDLVCVPEAAADADADVDADADADADTSPTCTCTDADRDGYYPTSCGDPNCSPRTDCDDTRPGVHPGAVEVCDNGLDDDCVGGDLPCSCTCTDGDGDGYFPTTCSDPTCAPRTDCDDGNRSVHPGAVEVCENGLDDDCVGGDAPCPCGCVDGDGDGYYSTGCGDPDCVPRTDCDDGNRSVHPGAAEVCGNGLDDDCVGGDQPCPCGCVDGDGDGYYATSCSDAACSPRTDCNDGDRAIHPGATEICDATDQDCDGLPYGAASPFTDVGVSEWWFPYIYAAWEAGVALGSGGGFNPYGPLDRAHAAVFVARAFGLAPRDSGAFCDMSLGMGLEYDHAIQALFDGGVTAGTTADCTASSTCYPPGGDDVRFCPLDPATRSQMAVFVYRALHPHSSCPTLCPNPGFFCDSDDAGSACGCIEALSGSVLEGGISSCSASSTCSPRPYCPFDTTTRGQAMVMLAKARGYPRPCVVP